MTNAKVRGAYQKFCTNCYIFRTKNHEIIKQVYFLTISPCKSMHFLQHSAIFIIPSSNQSFDMALSTSFTADFSSFYTQIFCHEEDPSVAQIGGSRLEQDLGYKLDEEEIATSAHLI